jgi:hypothetical protein
MRNRWTKDRTAARSTAMPDRFALELARLQQETALARHRARVSPAGPAMRVVVAEWRGRDT